MAERSLLGGSVTVTPLPVCRPGAADQPLVKRLLLDKGELAQVYTSADPIRTIAYIELRPATPRGNHYHDRRFELLYLIRGSCRLAVEDLATAARDETVLQAGDLAAIPPRIAHALEPLEAGHAIEFSSMEFDPADTLPHRLI